MIGQNINIRLNGTIFTAFQIFCAKRCCENSAEGIRAIVRELPEYKELAENKSTEPEPEKQQNSEEKKDALPGQE